jgi:hypothetical protein
VSALKLRNAAMSSRHNSPTGDYTTGVPQANRLVPADTRKHHVQSDSGSKQHNACTTQIWCLLKTAPDVAPRGTHTGHNDAMNRQWQLHRPPLMARAFLHIHCASRCAPVCSSDAKAPLHRLCAQQRPHVHCQNKSTSAMATPHGVSRHEGPAAVDQVVSAGEEGRLVS